MGDITKNFSYAEFEASATAKAKGIDNVAPAGVRAAIAALVRNVLQPLRDDLGVVVKVNSGYRCEELNALVGGGRRNNRLLRRLPVGTRAQCRDDERYGDQSGGNTHDA